MQNAYDTTGRCFDDFRQGLLRKSRLIMCPTNGPTETCCYPVEKHHRAAQEDFKALQVSPEEKQRQGALFMKSTKRQ